MKRQKYGAVHCNLCGASGWNMVGGWSQYTVFDPSRALFFRFTRCPHCAVTLKEVYDIESYTWSLEGTKALP